MTLHHHKGVWLSNRPLDCNEGVPGDVVLAIDIPEQDVAEYEWIQDIGYREFLIPAMVVNRYGPPIIVPEEDVFELLGEDS
jgi:hypothetical protein